MVRCQTNLGRVVDEFNADCEGCLLYTSCEWIVERLEEVFLSTDHVENEG